MSTAAEQEAKRHYPFAQGWELGSRRGFIDGWNECESRHRELLEAARVWAHRRDEWLQCSTDAEYDQLESAYERASDALMAAAAALNEEGGE